MLTEIALEAREPGHALCHATTGEDDARAVARILGERPDGAVSGAIAATPVAAQRLLDVMNGSGDHAGAAVVREDDGGVVVHVRSAASVRLGPLPPLAAAREVFGPDLVMGKAIAEGGRVRLGLRLVDAAGTRDVADALHRLQDHLGWAGFRVLRVASVPGRRHVEAVRCVLGPDEETLVRRALEMGYYRTPRQSTLADVAATLETSVSPVHKRLKRVERTLVTRFLDPHAVDGYRWRAKDRDLGDHLPPLTEVTVRVTWPELPLVAWAARREGARVLLERVAEDAKTERTTALVVVAARPAEAAGLVEELHAHDDVLEVRAGTRGNDHLAVKVVTGTPPETSWGGHPNPVPRLAACFGDGVLLRPILVEGASAWVRLVLVEGATVSDLEGRCDRATREGGWKGVDVVAARPLSPAAALVAATLQGDLTSRQEDVLRVAHALGYYETPKRCTLDDVARTLGTSSNAVHKSLSAAEQKLVHAHVASDL